MQKCRAAPSTGIGVGIDYQNLLLVSELVKYVQLHALYLVYATVEVMKFLLIK